MSVWFFSNYTLLFASSFPLVISSLSVMCFPPPCNSFPHSIPTHIPIPFLHLLLMSDLPHSVSLFILHSSISPTVPSSLSILSSVGLSPLILLIPSPFPSSFFFFSFSISLSHVSVMTREWRANKWQLMDQAQKIPSRTFHFMNRL